MGKLAIISYRCVGGNGDSFTMDAAALHSIVRVAQQQRIDHVWLDAWAYRKTPPWASYSHRDFMRTLLTVKSATTQHTLMDEYAFLAATCFKVNPANRMCAYAFLRRS